MERRDVLKLLASVTVLPAMTPEALFWFEGIHAQAATAATLKTLTSDQDATVTTIAEMIIPQTNTPGAKAAKVNEFIDLILSEWYDEARKTSFLAGVADVDAQSQKLYGKKFVACAEADQKKLLTTLDEEALAARKEEKMSGSGEGAAPPHFFSMMKNLTLIGYFTSQAGFTDALHKHIIPPTHKGCAVMTPGVA